jgi:sulfatase maturation enzyme AslB (radical SAM superfamily)
MMIETIGIGILHRGTGEVFLYIPLANSFVKWDVMQMDDIRVYNILISEDYIKGRFESFIGKQLQYYVKMVEHLDIGFILLTNECNMHCSFCYARANTDVEGGEFDVRYVERLLRLLGKEKGKSVNVSGGEPLLYFDKVREIKKYFDRVKIYTNGSLIDDDVAKWCIETGTKLFVSLDPDIEGHHESKPVRDSLEKLCKKYPEFRDLIEISIVYPMSRLNTTDFNDFVKQQRSFENGAKQEFQLIDDGGNFDRGEFQKLLEEQYDRVLCGSLSLYSSIFWRDMSIVPKVLEWGVNPVSCDLSVSVNYRGDLFLCQEHGSFSLNEQRYNYHKVGSVADDNFSRESFYSRIWDIIFERRLGLPCGIKRCWAQYWCGGLCWANLEVNPHLCDLFRMRLPFVLGLLINSQNIGVKLENIPVNIRI